MRSVLLLAILLLSPMAGEAQTFRGAWISSVYNINFPSKTGLSSDAQKAEIIRLLDIAKKCRLNAVLVQVRPEGDALYSSQLEPWSRYLTGTQGGSPGYDPLAFFISEGKKRGIGIHAWLNPYRAAASASSSRTANHVSNRLSQHAHRVGGVLMMDPGSPAVQDHIVNVVRDILNRYDVAGIHLDDYFYPYPSDSGVSRSLNDETTYAAYKTRGGSLGKADWRRDNVNSLIRKISQVVKQKPGALFGVSPFGIYTKGVPADVKAGVDQYNDLFSDPLKWIREGWVDYLAPQLYWKDGGPQSFSSLLRWWRSPQANPRGVPIWPGIAIDRLSSHGWPAGEIGLQLKIERSTPPRTRGGFVLWNIGPLKNNTKGVAEIIASE